MRKLIFAILIVFSACSIDDPAPDQMGCWTGVYKGRTERSFIGCLTYAEYKKQEPNDYLFWKWEVVDCKKCLDRYL